MMKQLSMHEKFTADNQSKSIIFSFADVSTARVTETPSTGASVPLTIVRQKGNYGVVKIEYQIFGGPNVAAQDFDSPKGT